MPDAADRLKDPVERAALLAAYAAGHVTPDEKAMVLHALASDPRLTAELEVFRAVRDCILDPQDATPGEWGWHRLRRDLLRQRQARYTWLPAAAAAVLVVVMVQGVMWWRAEPVGYAPLGNAHGSGTVIQLRFQADAMQADIDRLLRDVNAEFVAGPAASGLYRIRLRDDGPEAEQQALKALRERNDLVEYAGRER